VFSLATNGCNFNVLYTFSVNEFNDNTDGASPIAGLVLAGNTLYGAASREERKVRLAARIRKANHHEPQMDRRTTAFIEHCLKIFFETKKR
jgi:hypothetical protein